MQKSMGKKSWKMMKKLCKKWSKSNGKLMQNLIDCKKTDLHFDYEKPTNFNDFRVHAVQRTIKKPLKIIKKTASKRQWKKHEKSLKKRLKIEPKTMKNPFKNRCEKQVDFRIDFSGFFRNFGGKGFALFTFGKEG